MMNDQELENRPETLSRIKEILYGDELQSLEKRLADLRNEWTTMLENRIKTVEEQWAVREKAFDRKLKDLQHRLSETAEKNGQLDKDLQKAFEELKTLAGQLSQQHEENRKALFEMKTEWTQALKKLETAKVDKSEIADLFGLMMNKLK
jgi:DNA repair exonuclease SbcCD ATPase subunit